MTTPHISACGTVIIFLEVLLPFAIMILALCSPNVSGQTTCPTAQFVVSKVSEKEAREGISELLGGRVDIGKLTGSVSLILRSHITKAFFVVGDVGVPGNTRGMKPPEQHVPLE